MKIDVSPCRQLQGSLRVPGDKSIAHRALLVSLLWEGQLRIRGLPASLDVASSLAAVRTLSALSNLQLDIETHSPQGSSRGLQSQDVTISAGERAYARLGTTIDAGNSGSTMRMLLGILAGAPVDATVTGDESLSRRPMLRVVEPLRAMGASIEVSESGTAPIRVAGSDLSGAAHVLEVASAQVKSALLFAGLRASGTTSVQEPHATRDHTERLLKHLGAPVIEEKSRLIVSSISLRGDEEISIPGDLSSAAFLLVGAAITPGSDVEVSRVGLNPTRTGIIDILRRYGADVAVEDVREESGEPVGTVRVRGADRRPLEVSAPETVAAIDELPLIAVLGAFADGPTRLADASELRVKESDRIATIVAALRGLGGSIEPTPDGFVVEGRGGLSGGVADAAGDHRIAMAAAVAAMAAREPSTVTGWEAAAVSYPGFERDLDQLAVR